MEYWKNLSLDDLPNEEWRDVSGLEGIYKVSSFGRVKAVGRSTIRHDKRFKKPVIMNLATFIRRQAKDHKGYRRVGLYYNNKVNTHKVHRLVAETFIHNPTNKRTVNHKNGIKHDNRVENLEWATDKEQSMHARDNGLGVYLRGSSHGNSKLNELQVRIIKRMFDDFNQREIAAIFKVKSGTIGNIYRNKTWIHI